MADRSAKHALFEQLEVGAKAAGSGGQPNWSTSSRSVRAPLSISQHRCESVSWLLVDWRSGLIEPAQRAYGALLAGPVAVHRRARSAGGTAVSYSAGVFVGEWHCPAVGTDTIRGGPAAEA